MEEEKRRILNSLYIPISFVLVLWIIKLAEVSFNLHLRELGLFPRNIEKIYGVFTSYFIHGDFGHLTSNSIALLVMMISLFYFYRILAYKVLLYSFLFTGLLTWVIADRGAHIGASGLLYCYISFVFLSGILRKNIKLSALSLFVVFLHGSAVWNLFPHDFNKGISWEGHLAGFIVGIVLAIIYRKRGPQNDSYSWDDEEEEEEEETMEEIDKKLDDYLDKQRNTIH